MLSITINGETNADIKKGLVQALGLVGGGEDDAGETKSRRSSKSEEGDETSTRSRRSSKSDEGDEETGRVRRAVGETAVVSSGRGRKKNEEAEEGDGEKPEKIKADDIRKIFYELKDHQAHKDEEAGKEAVRKILTKFDAELLREIEPKDFAKAYDACRAALKKLDADI